MSNKQYQKQVQLLLSVLPEVAKEECFALHGGTAINLFVRDMPRLSVDIDLTYIPLEDRQASLMNINAALTRIEENIKTALPGVRTEHKPKIAKLLVNHDGVGIKIEVNTVGRGIIDEPKLLSLCDHAQDEFDAFVEMQIVPIAQLYGGKICAALDRQHPRDLFDIHYLLKNEGINDEIKKGFLYCLLGSDRPISEVLCPHFQDQRQAMENQFLGMSTEPFEYEAFEAVRAELVRLIHSSLTDEDKAFLLSVKNTTPDWEHYDFADFPSVRWKLQNLEKLKANDPDKHAALFHDLEKALDT